MGAVVGWRYTPGVWEAPGADRREILCSVYAPPRDALGWSQRAHSEAGWVSMAHAADLSNWGVPKLPLLKGVLHCDAVSKTSNASGVSINSSALFLL